jgi:hypothetical protein
MVVITRTSGSHKSENWPTLVLLSCSGSFHFVPCFPPFFGCSGLFVIGRVSSSLPYTRGATKAKVALFTIYPLLWSSYTYTLYIVHICGYMCVHMWTLMSRWRHHNILLATSYHGCKKEQLDKEGKKERKWLVLAATCAIEIQKNTDFWVPGSSTREFRGTWSSLLAGTLRKLRDLDHGTDLNFESFSTGECLLLEKFLDHLQSSLSVRPAD